ncbi:MAG: hypothetical protein K4305_10425 [Chlorobium sp.]|uniref:hypothetical protein n=1 Tax=Chlorobium sp. TaxID=1095 RepID=UPI002F40B99C
MQRVESFNCRSNNLFQQPAEFLLVIDFKSKGTCSAPLVLPAGRIGFEQLFSRLIEPLACGIGMLRNRSSCPDRPLNMATTRKTGDPGRMPAGSKPRTARTRLLLFLLLSFWSPLPKFWFHALFALFYEELQ